MIIRHLGGHGLRVMHWRKRFNCAEGAIVVKISQPAHHAFLSIMLLLSSCGTPTVGGSAMPAEGVWVPPRKQSVYLRSVFDDDPSDTLGRFIKAGTAASEVDESQSFAGRCSKFIELKVVGAGGTFDETFTSSSSARGSLGVEAIGKFGGGKLSGGYGTQGELRVKYTLRKKMIAKENADELSKCCQTAPNECSDKMIREFYMGDGEIYQFLGRETDVKAGGSYKIATAEVEVKNGTAWKRVTRFENVYFAFKTGAMASPGPDLCSSDWPNQRPQSLDGQYFVGVSKPASTEQAAFQDAMLDARRQVVQYIGTAIAEARVQTSKKLDEVWEDESAIRSASEGVARLVRDRCQRTAKPEGPTVRYHTKVLVFFPNTEIAAAARAMTDALAKSGHITKKDQEAVDKASENLNKTE